MPRGRLAPGRARRSTSSRAIRPILESSVLRRTAWTRSSTLLRHTDTTATMRRRCRPTPPSPGPFSMPPGTAGVGRVVDMSSLVVFALGATRVDETDAADGTGRAGLDRSVSSKQGRGRGRRPGGRGRRAAQDHPPSRDDRRSRRCPDRPEWTAAAGIAAWRRHPGQPVAVRRRPRGGTRRRPRSRRSPGGAVLPDIGSRRPSRDCGAPRRDHRSAAAAALPARARRFGRWPA